MVIFKRHTASFPVEDSRLSQSPFQGVEYNDLIYVWEIIQMMSRNGLNNVGKSFHGNDRLQIKEKEPDSALGSLLDGYGSSSSDDVCDEKLAAEKTTNIVVKEKNELSLPTVQKNGSSQQSRPANYRIRPCKYFMRNGSCRNGDACNFSHEIQNDARCNNNNKMNKRQKTKTSSSTTLLRKLLENDTKREATLSLQLLEYLVDCNYLQKQRNSNNDAT